MLYRDGSDIALRQSEAWRSMGLRAVLFRTGWDLVILDFHLELFITNSFQRALLINAIMLE